MIRRILFLVFHIFVCFSSYGQKDLKLDAEFLENEPIWKVISNSQGYWCWGGVDSTKIWLINESDQVFDYSDVFRQLTNKKFTDLLVLEQAVYVGTDGDYVLKYEGGFLSRLQNGINAGNVEKLSISNQYKLCIRTPSETYISYDFTNFSKSKLKRLTKISDNYSSTVFLWDSTTAELCGKTGVIQNLRSDNQWWDKRWENNLILEPGDKINSVFIEPYSSLDTINIYAGLNSGLYLLKEGCDVKRFLKDTIVHHITRLRLDEVVACTSKGLILINVKDGVSINKTYLKDIEVYAMEHDGGNYIWIGTNKGIKRYQAYQYSGHHEERFACPSQPLTIWAPEYKYPQYQKWLKDGVIMQDSIARTIIIDKPGTYKAVSYYGPASSIMDTSVYEVIPFPMNDVTLNYPSNQKFCKNTEYSIWVDTPDCKGCTFKWERDGEIIEDYDSYLITSLPGEYSVEVTNCNGLSRSAKVKMEIYAVDSIYIIGAPSVALCANKTVTLRSSKPSYNATWYLNDRYLSTNTEIKVNTPGIYIMAYFDGCTTKYDTAEILFHDTPFAYLELDGDKIVAKNELFKDGKLVFYSEVSSYQWYYNEKKMPNENKFFLEPSKVGIYKVEVQNAFGCTNFSQPYNYNVTGKEDPFVPQGINVYPNPSNDVFNVTMPHILESRQEFEIYDSQGILIRKGSFEKSFEVSLSQKGVFFLWIKAGNEVFTKKIIRL